MDYIKYWTGLGNSLSGRHKSHGCAAWWGGDAAWHVTAGVGEDAFFVLLTEGGENFVTAGRTEGTGTGGRFDESTLIREINELAAASFEVAGGDINSGRRCGRCGRNCSGKGDRGSNKRGDHEN